MVLFFQFACNSVMNLYTVNYYNSSNMYSCVRTSQLGTHKWIMAYCDMSVSSILGIARWHLAMTSHS